MNMMDYPRCDCPQHRNFTDFCIENQCLFNRRLCGICRNQHLNHAVIRYDDPKSFDVYTMNSNNQNAKFMEAEIKKTLHMTDELKNKIITELKDIVSLFEKTFDKSISEPLKTLLETTNNTQPQQKIASIAGVQTSGQKLSVLAEEIRSLSKPHFQQIQWIRNMIECLCGELTIFKRNTEQPFQILTMEIQKLQSISPFAISMETKVKQAMKQKAQKLMLEELKKKKDRQTQQFLQKFSGNLIEWNGFYFTAQKWRSLRKNIDGIDLRYQNLDMIPAQLNLFSGIKRLSLNYNNIRNISNLESLKKLQVLGLGNNKIVEISGLEELKALQQLNLYNNQITQIQGLQNLNQLKQLSLWNNKIRKVQNLEHLTHLIYLDLNSNPIEKIESAVKLLSKMKKEQLKTLYLPQEWTFE